MLILSRRNGESFIIGDDIKITVLSQRSNQVRIGIDAPRELPVFREEVLVCRKREQTHQAQHEKPASNGNVLNTVEPKKLVPKAKQFADKLPEEIAE